MKLLLRYHTALGPRTIISEVTDEATAQAVRAAHEALGETASLVEEMPRLSMQAHMNRHRKQQKRAALRLIASDPKVTPLKRARKP